jgi:hypothetical protein
MESLLSKLIVSHRELRNGKNIFRTPRIAPISNFEDYYRSKVRSEGCVTDRLKELKAFHDKRGPPRSIVLSKSYKYPHDFDHVGMSLKVSKKGTIKVSLSLPFHNLYNEYQSKAIQPPVEERVKYSKAAGYPDDILINIVKKYKKAEDEKEKNILFLENIFGGKK